MNDLDKIIVLTEEIALLRSRFRDNSGMGNINTAIRVMEKRVEELQTSVRNPSTSKVFNQYESFE